MEVVSAVVDLLAAVPVVVIHVVAALPFLVLDVLLFLPGMIVPVVVLLGCGCEGRAANGEEDACGESFVEQDVTSG